MYTCVYMYVYTCVYTNNDVILAYIQKHTSSCMYTQHISMCSGGLAHTVCVRV